MCRLLRAPVLTWQILPAHLRGPLRPRPVPCRALRSRNLRHLPVNVRSGPLVCRLLRAPLLVWTTIQNFLTPPLRPLRPRSVPCRALSSFPRQLGRANPWRFHLSRHSRTRSRRPCLDNLGRQGLPLSRTCEPRQFSYNLRSLQFFPLSEIPVGQLKILASVAGCGRGLRRYTCLDRQFHVMARRAAEDWSLTDYFADAIGAKPPVRAQREAAHSIPAVPRRAPDSTHGASFASRARSCAC